MVMSRWRVMVVALTALMAMLLEARAEEYPTRNVIILVPFAPGGGTDLARDFEKLTIATDSDRVTIVVRPRDSRERG